MKKKRGKIRKNHAGNALVSSLIFVLITAVALLIYIKINTPRTVTTYGTSNVTKAKNPTNTLLESEIQNVLQGTQGSYGIYIKNLKTGELYSLNANTKYDTASLYKLWVMAATYEKIDANALQLQSVISANVTDLNDTFNISNEYAELSEGTITLTVQDALTQMITVSDNYAALLLSKRIGLSAVNEYLINNDFKQSSIGSSTEGPTSTPTDIGLFLERLYTKQVVSNHYSDEMVELLKAQKIKTKLPKYLPDTVQIAHKTGELDAVTHDAGIVFLESGDYIIVVMSKSNQPQIAADKIARISEVVYKYFK